MWNAIDGKKTYIALGVGALVVLVNHFIAPVPGVNLNSANWLNDLWTIAAAAAGRHGIAKAGG